MYLVFQNCIKLVVVARIKRQKCVGNSKQIFKKHVQILWAVTIFHAGYKYLMMILEASVFPEPDSPEITIQVSLPDLFIVL